MVEIHVEGDQIVFEVQGWDRLWALRSRLTIPAAHIRGVVPAPNVEMHWLDALKLMGTGVPELFRAGTFLQKDGIVFWDVREPENAIVVELEHEHFKKLVIEVADPRAAVQTIASAAGVRRG